VLLPSLRSVLGAVGRLAPAHTLEQLTRQLTAAGRPGNLAAADFLGLCVMMALVGLVLGVLYGRGNTANSGNALLAPLAGTLVGFMAPRFWLSSRSKNRKNVIQRSLPDALDMLTICVEAGLAFESALQRVSERWRGPLSDEFARVVAEIRLGVPRAEGLRRLAQRCDTPDVSSFVAVMVQADSMGSSVAPVIHSQADQIRTLRRQRAEEKANKAPIKVLMAMLIFIFPALFVVILGPAVPRIMEAFGQMGAR
jgi:tight adherence protein C